MKTITESMHDAGIIPKKQIDNNTLGKIKRFDLVGEKSGSLSGWYWCNGDDEGAFGAFGNWKTGETHKFSARSENTMTAEERALRQAERERLQAEQDAERERLRGVGAMHANKMLNDAERATVAHGYANRKRINPVGAFVGAFQKFGYNGEAYATYNDCLLIPMINSKGKIVNLQAILPKKPESGTDKFFVNGAQKKGCYHLIAGDFSKIAVCEGYATGVTIHECTGYAVAVAFDAGNLDDVAQLIPSIYANSKILIACDNDQYGAVNTGIEAGKKIKQMLGYDYVYPVFSDTNDKPTDFNDLMILEGRGAVLEQINGAKKPDQDQPAKQCDVITDMIAGFDFPDQTAKQKPKGTLANFDYLMTRLGVDIRYNVIKKSVDIVIPNHATSIDNRAESAQANIISAIVRNDMPTVNAGSYITALADLNQFNPVCEFIERKPWDGVERVTKLIKTIKTTSTTKDDKELDAILITRWMTAAVAAAYSKSGIVMRGVLTMTGKQRVGKSKWLKRLMPAELDVIKDGVTLNTEDKDSVLGAVSHWIVELGELDATFKRSDVAALKAFITRDKDKIRRPYARTESEYPRRTVFAGSVNTRDFLRDETGSSRFWVLDVVDIDHDHDIDMQQAWAEIKARFYDKGIQYWLTDDESDRLELRNREFEPIDPVEEKINASFCWTQEYAFNNRLVASKIADIIGVNADKSVTNRISAILRKRGIEQTRTASGRYFVMPDKK